LNLPMRKTDNEFSKVKKVPQEIHFKC